GGQVPMASLKPGKYRSPVGVGIIGAGSVLWAYLNVLDRLVSRGYCTAGPICARRREAWPELLARRPGLQLVADALAVVESDVEIVVVITPPDSHVELSRLALEHDKHVLVEKPLSLSYRDAEALVDLAAARKLYLFLAPFVQLAPTFRALWSYIRE